MIDVEELAKEIRRVDGSHDLSAAELAEQLEPYLSSLIADHWHEGHKAGAQSAFDQAVSAISKLKGKDDD